MVSLSSIELQIHQTKGFQYLFAHRTKEAGSLFLAIVKVTQDGLVFPSLLLNVLVRALQISK